MTPCRDCGNHVSPDAYMCPRCGAPRPANPKWDGWGFEYKSASTLFGLPLLHVSFKYRNSRPVVAKGIIAIGQFGAGIVNISQFGIGVFSLGQFTVAYRAIAQIALVVDQGHGQLVYRFTDIIAKL